jgi:predicted dehydrogenase
LTFYILVKEKDMTAEQPLQPLRVGIIGVGWPGMKHLEAFRKLEHVEVVALADVNEKRLAQFNSTYQVPNLYTDPHELIARSDLDIVSMCTPNYLHAPLTVEALRAGKHVLCEKPLARTAEEGQTMIDAARETGRALEVVFNHRQRGDVQIIKRYIDEGRLGRIYYAKASWMRRNGIPGMGGWFTNHETAGGGPLIDLGVHMLDMALYLMSEPEVAAVSAATYAELGPRGKGSRGDNNPNGANQFNVEDLATAFIRMADGSTLTLEASWAVYRQMSDVFGVDLFGTEGGAELSVRNYVTQGAVRIFTDAAGAPADIEPHFPTSDGHDVVARKFVDILRSGQWSHLDGREGLRRTRIIDACYQSAREGREVALAPLAKPL